MTGYDFEKITKAKEHDYNGAVVGKIKKTFEKPVGNSKILELAKIEKS